MATNKRLQVCHGNQQKPQILSKFGFMLSKISEYSKIVIKRNFGKLCLINGTEIWVQHNFHSCRKTHNGGFKRKNSKY